MFISSVLLLLATCFYESLFTGKKKSSRSQVPVFLFTFCNKNLRVRIAHLKRKQGEGVCVEKRFIQVDMTVSMTKGRSIAELIRY